MKMPSHWPVLPLAAVVIACDASVSVRNGSIPTEPPPSAVVEVHISDSRFSPANIVVLPGTLVRWINDGPSTHTSTSETGVWDSGEIGPPLQTGGTPGVEERTYGRVFAVPGIFLYECGLHPQKRGTVVVSDTSSATLP